MSINSFLLYKSNAAKGRSLVWVSFNPMRQQNRAKDNLQMLVLIKVAEDSTQKERHTGEIWYDIPYPQSLNRNDTNELIYTHNLRE